MPSIRRMGETFASDHTVTLEEAKALVAKAKEDGKVGFWDQLALKRIVARYKDQFQPGALAGLKAILEPASPTATGAAGAATNLDPSGVNREVFLNASGLFT